MRRSSEGHRRPIFVNADLIAAGISPFIPELTAFHVGRLMIEEIKRRAASSESFAFETTLSGRTYAQMIPEWQRMGYKTKLIFLYLPDVLTAIERVRLFCELRLISDSDLFSTDSIFPSIPRPAQDR